VPAIGVFKGEFGDFKSVFGVFKELFRGFEREIVAFKSIFVAYRRHSRHKRRKSNKGAGVAFYDSTVTYDSGLFYDDPSSPQPNRRKMAKVKLGLRNLTPDEKVELANTIKTAMTGNANFTTPNPTLTSHGTMITTSPV
jgi:hypothetical protein